jgi:hypothetical protein
LGQQWVNRSFRGDSKIQGIASIVCIVPVAKPSYRLAAISVLILSSILINVLATDLPERQLIPPSFSRRLSLSAAHSWMLRKSTIKLFQCFERILRANGVIIESSFDRKCNPQFQALNLQSSFLLKSSAFSMALVTS